MSRVLDAIAARAEATPDRTAVVSDGVPLTWRELQREVRDAADWLDAELAQAAPDAPVGVALDNCAAWVVLDLALVSLGRPSVPLPPFFTAEQRRHVLADAGAVLVVGLSAAASPPTGVVAGLPLRAERTGFDARPLPPGTAKITYTSGSTGAPKGVCLSQAQMEAVAESLVSEIGAEFARRHLAVLPLGVLLENVAGLYPTLLAGGTYYVRGLAELGFGNPFRPEIGRLADAIAADEITSVILVPELLRALTGYLLQAGRRLASLELAAVGGAKVSPQVIAAARAAGIPAFEGYGLSECASVVALNTPREDMPGAVGRVLPHLRVTLDADGEILVSPMPFLGYVGAPQPAGPLRTGDLGAVGPDGFLRITGRKSNLIITAFGRNVAPEWVESELLSEPEIAQAAVFGEGAAELCAVVVPSRPDLAGAAIEAAVARANTRLPGYAQVGRWRAAPPFDPGRGELTGNGRPRRAVLRQTHQTFIDLQP